MAKMTALFSNCFSHHFSKQMPLLVQDDSDIHFSSILWSCITLTPHSLETVILQRFLFCFLLAQSPALSSCTWEAAAVSFHFPFGSSSQSDLINKNVDHFLPPVNFLLIKLPLPAGNTTSLCCCCWHLQKWKTL